MSNKPDMVILDAGCGIGNFIIPLSSKCKYIYGIDFSEGSLKICNARLKEQNIENVSIKNASIIKMPFDSKSADRILCYSVLQYFNPSEISVVIKEFKRILKEDGFILIDFLNGGSINGISTKLFRFFRQLIKGKKEYPITNISLKKLSNIIKNEKGTLEILHSTHFYPILFPSTIIKFISNRLYYERFLPKYLQKYGLDLLVKVQFEKEN